MSSTDLDWDSVEYTLNSCLSCAIRCAFRSCIFLTAADSAHHDFEFLRWPDRSMYIFHLPVLFLALRSYFQQMWKTLKNVEEGMWYSQRLRKRHRFVKLHTLHRSSVRTCARQQKETRYNERPELQKFIDGWDLWDHLFLLYLPRCTTRSSSWI